MSIKNRIEYWLYVTPPVAQLPGSNTLGKKGWMKNGIFLTLTKGFNFWISCVLADIFRLGARLTESPLFSLFEKMLRTSKFSNNYNDSSKIIVVTGSLSVINLIVTTKQLTRHSKKLLFLPPLQLSKIFENNTFTILLHTVYRAFQKNCPNRK